MLKNKKTFAKGWIRSYLNHDFSGRAGLESAHKDETGERRCGIIWFEKTP